MRKEHFFIGQSIRARGGASMLTGDVFYKIIRIGSNALTVTSESGTNCNFSYGRFLEFFYEPGPVPQDNYLIFN